MGLKDNPAELYEQQWLRARFVWCAYPPFAERPPTETHWAWLNGPMTDGGRHLIACGDGETDAAHWNIWS